MSFYMENESRREGAGILPDFFLHKGIRNKNENQVIRPNSNNFIRMTKQNLPHNNIAKVILLGQNIFGVIEYIGCWKTSTENITAAISKLNRYIAKLHT